MLAPFTGLVLDVVAVARTDRVLDIGCGTGSTTCAAARAADDARCSAWTSHCPVAAGRTACPTGWPEQRRLRARRRVNASTRTGKSRRRHQPLRSDVVQRPTAAFATSHAAWAPAAGWCSCADRTSWTTRVDHRAERRFAQHTPCPRSTTLAIQDTAAVSRASERGPARPWALVEGSATRQPTEGIGRDDAMTVVESGRAIWLRGHREVRATPERGGR